MKRMYFFALLIIMPLLVLADQSQPGKLDPQYLNLGNWQESGYGEVSMTFSMNSQGWGTFRFIINYEDDMPWQSDEGLLDHQGSVMYFRRIEGNDYSRIPDGFFDQSAQVRISESNLIYREYLDIQPMGLRLWNLRERVQPGDRRNIAGTSIIMINTFGTANDDVSVRNGPGTEYDRFPLRLYNGQTYYPKGSQIYIYGRTEETQVIGQWEAHWYLIHAPEHVMSSYSMVDATKKWVYGEFIDLNILQ